MKMDMELKSVRSSRLTDPANDSRWSSRSTRASGGHAGRPRRIVAYARITTCGWWRRWRLTPRMTGCAAGSRPTPRPATIMSWTSSRLSARCAIRGWKPASEPTTRSTCSSAVLRELTIQS